MSSNATARPRPGRGLRLMLRVPVLLYRLGFAGQLGERDIMLLTTTGRRSGRQRVSGLNYAVDGATVYVAAGWGPRTGWYQNLLAKPEVAVQIGRRRLAARGRPVTDASEAARACALLEVASPRGGPPKALRPLLSRLGFDFDSERAQAFREPAKLTMVALALGAPPAPTD